MSRLIKGLVVPVGLVALAEIGARVNGIHSDYLAVPSIIIATFFRMLFNGELLVSTGQTFTAAFSGLAIGAGLGFLVSILFGLFPTLRKLLFMTTETVRPIPSVALIPIAMLVFGFGYRMEISIIAFAVFWPVMIIGQSAVSNIEPRLIEVAKALRMSFRERVFKIVLPAALPRYFVALRLATAGSLIVAVTVEIAANPLGLGYRLMIAEQTLNADQMFATLLWVSLVGWTLNQSLLALQNRVFHRMAAPHGPAQ